MKECTTDPRAAHSARIKRHPITMGAAIKILSEPPWELYRRMSDDYKTSLRMAIKSLTADKLNIERGP